MSPHLIGALAHKPLPTCSVARRHRLRLLRGAQALARSVSDSRVSPASVSPALASGGALHLDVHVHVRVDPAPAPEPLSLWGWVRYLAWD